MPLTILGILGLFFIPMFQYCHEIRLEAERNSDQELHDKSKRTLLALIWVNFIVAILFGLEIAMKSYAFGLRRAFS